MEPKETQSFPQSQQPHLNQTTNKVPPTVRVEGSSPLSSSSGNGDEPPPTTLWEGLRLPMKWAIAIVVPLFVLILLASGLWNLAQGFLKSFNSPKSTPTTQTSSQPTTTPNPTTSPTTASSEQNNCTDLPARMAKANITAAQVDKLFYQTYPDRVNKPLTTDTKTDRNLRQEWCSIANQLIDKK
jgi:cytoskeletal protein RodZ